MWSRKRQKARNKNDCQRKKFYVGKKLHNVQLKKEGTDYILEVDGTVYKKTPNELFAIQAFNEI